MRRMFSEKQIKEFIANQKKNINTLVDSQGRDRFIEDDIEIETLEGFTFSYYKWSLSGTHLMIVVAGKINNATVVAGGTILGIVRIPEWVFNKIIPLYQGTQNVALQNVNLYKDGETNQTIQARLAKGTTALTISFSSLTLNADREYRFNFDLLIDSD